MSCRTHTASTIVYERAGVWRVKNVLIESGKVFVLLYSKCHRPTGYRKWNYGNGNPDFFTCSLLLNPEIEALNPKTGDRKPKPGEFGSNPESWQPYSNVILTTIFHCLQTHSWGMIVYNK